MRKYRINCKNLEIDRWNIIYSNRISKLCKIFNVDKETASILYFIQKKHPSSFENLKNKIVFSYESGFKNYLYSYITGDFFDD